MRLRSPARILGLVAVAIAAAAPTNAQRLVPTSDPDHPRLRFADSLLSINDRCIVSSAKLNPRIAPVYVNGEAVGFC